MIEHRNRETVQFLSNVPVQVALPRPDGKIVSGVYGERMMYTLSDGRVMFLELDVAAQINRLEVQANEAFWICKQRLSGKGMRHIWKVWRGDDEPATVDGETPLQ